MRSDRGKKTYDIKNAKYSPELIRELADPEYLKAAEAYERQAQRQRESGGRAAGRQRTKEEEAWQQQLQQLQAQHTGPTGRNGKPVKQKKRKKNKKEKGGKQGKRYRFRWLKLCRNLLILLLIIGVAAGGLILHMTKNFERMDVDVSDSQLAIDPQVADDLSGYRNILILGSDARMDEGLDGSRTDAIIIMSIKKSSGDIHLISVMRDSYLCMEYMDGSMILDKITHAHHYSGGLNTVAALNRSLDLNIREYVVFTWKAVADAVDTLGGVELDIKEEELSDLNSALPGTAENVGGTAEEITQAGPQTVNGVQAVSYCRIRKNSGGDAGRTQRNKVVIAAVMKKALTHPWKLPELSEKVFPQIRTNMDQKKMLTAGLNAPRYDMQDSISWPEEYYAGLLSDGISYVVPLTLESEVQRLHEAAFGQAGYQVSDTCRQISDDIIYDTGLQ